MPLAKGDRPGKKKSKTEKETRTEKEDRLIVTLLTLGDGKGEKNPAELEENAKKVEKAYEQALKVERGARGTSALKERCYGYFRNTPKCSAKCHAIARFIFTSTPPPRFPPRFSRP